MRKALKTSLLVLLATAWPNAALSAGIASTLPQRAQVTESDRNIARIANYRASVADAEGRQRLSLANVDLRRRLETIDLRWHQALRERDIARASGRMAAARIKELEGKALALEGEMARVVEEMTTQLAQRDSTYAQQLRDIVATNDRYLETQEGREAQLLLALGGDENIARAALLLDELGERLEQAEDRRAAIRKAQHLRDQATLFLRIRGHGIATTEYIIGLYERATRSDPGNYRDLIELSRLYRENGRINDAVKAARSAGAIASLPNDRAAAIIEEASAMQLSVKDDDAAARFESGADALLRLMPALMPLMQGAKNLPTMSDEEAVRYSRTVFAPTMAAIVAASKFSFSLGDLSEVRARFVAAEAVLTSGKQENGLERDLLLARCNREIAVLESRVLADETSASLMKVVAEAGLEFERVTTRAEVEAVFGPKFLAAMTLAAAEATAARARYPAIVPRFERNIALMRAAVTQDSTSVPLQIELADGLLEFSAFTASERSSNPVALSIAREALALAERSTADHPDYTPARELLARARLGLARILKGRNDLAGATEQAGGALRVYQELDRNDPTAVTARGIAAALEQLAALKGSGISAGDVVVHYELMRSRNMLAPADERRMALAQLSASALMTEVTAERYGGIGVTMSAAAGGVRVDELSPNSPAESAGLRVGDVIVGVDGRPLASDPMEDARKRIRGAAGTPVILTITRSGRRAPFEIRIVRANVKVERTSSSNARVVRAKVKVE